MSDCAKGRTVREATNTPMTTLKESKPSAAELGESLHAVRIVRWVLHQSKLWVNSGRDLMTFAQQWLSLTRSLTKAHGRLEGQMEDAFLV